VLAIKEVSKSYGKHMAVQKISMHVNTGTIFGLLGPNGAGKSSLLRMITGITKPDSGEILLNSKPFILEEDAAQIGYMPEERGMYKKMKVREHAIYLAQLKGMTKQSAQIEVDHWFDKLDMQSWSNKKVQDLSKGMSQKLQFVITVVHKPSLLILDEPFSGLDPVNAEVIKQEIFNLSTAGQTVIFSTHRMEQVEEICEEILLMNQGESIASGNIQELKEKNKDGLFELQLLDDSLQNMPEFEIVDRKANSYKVKKAYGISVNEMLQACMNSGHSIVGFRELLPSLNDVFIKLVAGKAVTKFVQ
jgi:ABC-2 type transport system ATP-binding protein